MLPPARLALRRLRLELLICLCASLGLAATTLILASGIAAAKGTESLSFWVEFVGYDTVALVCLPILTGLVFSTSLVAAELDRGTSVFAWSVVLGRGRWLADACAAGILMLVVTSIPIAVASDVLGGALGPQLEATRLPGVELAWPLLVLRAITALAIAALVGVVAGRSLPTLLVGIVATCFVLATLEVGFAAWRYTRAVPIDPSVPGVFYVGDRTVAVDGRVLTDQEAQIAAAKLGIDFGQEYQRVAYGLEPDARTWILAGQMALTTATGAAGLVVASILVERRRPV